MSRFLLTSLLLVCTASIASALRCLGCQATIDANTGELKCTDNTENWGKTFSVADCKGSCVTALTVTFESTTYPRAVVRLGCVAEQLVDCYKNIWTNDLYNFKRVCGCKSDNCNDGDRPCSSQGMKMCPIPRSEATSTITSVSVIAGLAVFLTWM